MATLVWALLAAVGVGFEVYALRSKRKGDTLSEHVWALNAFAKKRGVLFVAHILTVGTLGWLALHFTTGL